MRSRMLALAIAAGVLSSGPLQGQNSLQAHFLEPNTLMATAVTPAVNTAATTAAATSVTDTTVHIDWREKGAVTPVGDVGQCGSEWAFSAKGAVEGEHFIHGGSLIDLSAQQLVDCAGSTGAQACNGGSPEQGLLFIKANGAVTKTDYPYTARQGTCKKTAKAVAKIGSIKRSPIGDDAALLNMLKTDGPVAVLVDDYWIHGYTGAIHTCPARTSALTPALLVGAITRNGEPVWVLKFAFGTAFGDHGYAYLSRLRPNECGITDDAIVPLP